VKLHLTDSEVCFPFATGSKSNLIMGCTGSSLKARLEELEKEKDEALERASKAEEELERFKEAHVENSAVLVLGSSGMVGKATVRALVEKNPDRAVFAGMRDTSKAKDLGFPENVIPIRIDMGDIDEVAKVIIENQIKSVFAVIPGSERRAEIGQAVVSAARKANVGGLLMLSVLTAEKTDTIFGRQFEPIEKATRESGIPHAIIRLPLFMENALGNIGSVVSEGKIYNCMDPDAKFSTVNTNDVGVAAAVLLDDLPNCNGKLYNLVSETYSSNELAAATGEAIDKKVEYVNVGFDATKQSLLSMGMPSWQVDGILELFKLINEKDPVVSQESEHLQTLLGRAPTKIGDFLDSVKAMFKEPNEVSSMAKPVLLLASTGFVGVETAKSLSGAGASVVAGMRDIAKAQKSGLSAIESCQSVEMKLTKESVANIVKEYSPSSIFLIIPGSEKRTELGLNALKGIQEAGFSGFLLLLSVLSADFEGTIFADQFRPVEEVAKESGLKFCIVRLPVFTDNVLAHRDTIMNEGKIFGPVPGDIAYASATTEDIGAAASAILLNPAEHEGKVYNIVSDAVSNNDIAKFFSAALEKDVEYQEIDFDTSLESMKSLGFPEWQAKGINELNKLIEEKKPVMISPSPDLENVLQRKPTSTQQFISSITQHFKA